MTIRPDHEWGRDCPNYPNTCLICQPKIEAAGRPALTLTVTDGPGTPEAVRAQARSMLYGGTARDTDGTILRGPSLPCGCPLDADCDGRHPGALP